MAVEPRRACGYRKVGGVYLCGEGSGIDCCKMPIMLSVCPTCGNGIKQARGWTWIDPRPWLKGECKIPARSWFCPLSSQSLGDKVGLLWIGTAFYPTPEIFNREAEAMGISKRIGKVPRGFVLGEHWVFLAHPRVRWHIEGQGDDAEQVWEPGVFRVFKPNAIEKIVTETQAKDELEMARLTARNITPVVVPDDDMAHQGTVYDDDQMEMNLDDQS